MIIVDKRPIKSSQGANMVYKKWSDSELSYIKHHYLEYSDKIIAEKLSEMTGQNITSSMIRRQRRNLKIEKAKGRPKLERNVE